MPGVSVLIEAPSLLLPSPWFRPVLEGRPLEDAFLTEADRLRLLKLEAVEAAGPEALCESSTPVRPPRCALVELKVLVVDVTGLRTDCDRVSMDGGCIEEVPVLEVAAVSTSCLLLVAVKSFGWRNRLFDFESPFVLDGPLSARRRAGSRDGVDIV